MRLTDLLALSHVPRWTVVDHSRPQSVADHTFRVLVIATELARRVEVELTCATLIQILSHDAAESRTGDIPTPAKNLFDRLEDHEVALCPWITREPENCPIEQFQVFALADQIEAYTFICRYGIGPHAHRVSLSICEKITAMCPSQWNSAVWKLVGEIGGDDGR